MAEGHRSINGLMAEERECLLVGAHEDGRIFPTKMSLASWRRIENARRAGEEKRSDEEFLHNGGPSLGTKT